MPTSPQIILTNFLSILTPYEQEEILKFPLVYCIGIEANKPHLPKNTENFGFDDENGNYKAFIHDHIALVEIDVLKTLRKNDELNAYNIVHIQSSFSFRNHIVIDK